MAKTTTGAKVMQLTRRYRVVETLEDEVIVEECFGLVVGQFFLYSTPTGRARAGREEFSSTKGHALEKRRRELPTKGGAKASFSAAVEAGRVVLRAAT